MAEQATYVSVFDASQARLVQQARAALALEAAYQPTDRLERSALDLRFGLESIGLLPNPAQALATQAYVQETYGLQNAGLDPLLKPDLPVIPASGATVRHRVLAVNGGGLLVNSMLLTIGAELVPVTAPVFNTQLLPTQTVAGFTYNGLANSFVTVDTPVNLLALDPRSYVAFMAGNSQVGRLDYPPSAVGNGFTLTVGARTYQGALPDSAKTGNLYSLPI